MPAPKRIYTHFPVYISNLGPDTKLADPIGYTNAPDSSGYVRIANLGGSGPVIREGRAGLVQHAGTDLGLPIGTQLVSVYNGVAKANKGGTCGYSVTITSEFGRYRTTYCHMSYIEPLIVNAGSTGVLVRGGQLVGRSGGGNAPVGAGSAASTAPHLHIETQVLNSNDTPTGWYINSLAYLNDFVGIPTVRTQNGVLISGGLPWKWRDPGAGISFPVNVSEADKNIVSQGTSKDPSIKENLDRVLAGTANNAPGTEVPRITQVGTNAVQPSSGGTPGISPYIASLDSFHPKIQYELIRRRMASETVNTHMPYVRLTSLTKILPKNLDDATRTAWCPSLGIVGEPEISFDDILTPKNKRSIVGYATTLGKQEHERVPVIVETSEDDPENIPPAGIVSFTAERSTAGPMGVRGGLFKANLKVVANSLGQFNALLRYFLRPGTRVVLEMGRESTSSTQQPVTFFNWKQSEETLRSYFEEMIVLRTGQRKMIDEYIFKNFGNYELFIGYVVTFKSKYTKNNTFEIDLTIHSVQQFEVPVKVTGANALCPGRGITDSTKPLDLEDYFKVENITSKDSSFYGILAKVNDNKNVDLYNKWNLHVVALRGNGTDATHAGTGQPGYLLSWKFFVNVILRDTTYGIPSVFQINPNIDKNTLSLLLASMPAEIKDDIATSTTDLGVLPNEVGFHQSLRSTNPGVMLIDNTIAQAESDRRDDFTRKGRSAIQRINSTNPDNRIDENSIVYEGVRKAIEDARTKEVPSFDENGNTLQQVSSLTRGVWINSNAIADAFSSTDIVSNGLAKLLTAMNNATEGYWNLQLLSDDLNNPGTHIIDMGLSKPNNKKVVPNLIDNLVAQTPSSLEADLQKLSKAKDEPRYMYVFNKATTTYEQDDIGGELLDINLESSLPQVIAVQAIAGIGGIAQRGTLEAIDIDELRKISLVNAYSDTCPPCSDPNDSVPTENNSNNLFTSSELRDIAQRYAVRDLNERGTSVALEGEIRKLLKEKYNRVETLTDIVEGVLSFIPGLGVNNTFYDVLSSARTQVNQAIEQYKTEFDRSNGELLSIVKQYAGAFGNVLKWTEFDRTRMLRELDGDAEQSPCSVTKNPRDVHSFNSSNLTKTVVDITMPGIGGLQLFQSFWVDRTPKILNTGYFVVTKISHDFSIEKGWTTKVQGRYRHQSSRDARIERRNTDLSGN